MKDLIQKMLATAVCAIILVSITGCEEEQKISNPRRDRVLAAENIQLKEQLQQSKERISKCSEEKREMKKWHKQKLDELTKVMVVPLLDKKKALQDENERLTKENDKLKGQIEQLKEKLE